MINTLKIILEKTLGQLSDYFMAYVPSLLAGLIILLGAYMAASLARWLLNHLFKGKGVERFLSQSGIASLLARTGRLHATRLVAATAYWGILALGFLTALNVFETQLTTRLLDTLITLFPHLAAATLMLLVGYWLGQLLGRIALVWAVNEGLPGPRRLAAAVRVFILVLAVVVAADYLNFARGTFLAAFVIVAGGCVLALSLSLGLGGREAVRRYLERSHIPGNHPNDVEPEEPALWKHL